MPPKKISIPKISATKFSTLPTKVLKPKRTMSAKQLENLSKGRATRLANIKKKK